MFYKKQFTLQAMLISSNLAKEIPLILTGHLIKLDKLI